MAMAALSPALPKSALWGSRIATGVCSKNAGMCARPALLVQAKKKIEGKVVCASNDKTVSVEVNRLVVDPKSKRRLRRTKNYHAHDPENECKLGDVVTLAMSRPFSKTKRFIVSGIKGREMIADVAKAAALPTPLPSSVVEDEKPAEELAAVV